MLIDSKTTLSNIRNDFEPARLELRELAAGRPTDKNPIGRLIFYVSLQLVYTVRRAIPWLRGPEICFFPQRPHAHYAMWPVCQFLGIKRTAHHSRADLVCLWVDSDYDEDADERARVALDRALGDSAKRVINIRCTDVSKRTVARAFEDVFDHPLSVDPTTYQGLAVEKSNANARHDGRLVQCPLPVADPDCAYHVFVDSQRTDHLVQNIRVLIVGSSIPFVYSKYRKPDERFSEELALPATIRETSDFFSREEVELILRMCQKLGADLGEVDVVRDNASHLIYVVDVNKTSYGPPKWIGFLDRYRAAIRLARAFRTEFLADPTDS